MTKTSTLSVLLSSKHTLSATSIKNFHAVLTVSEDVQPAFTEFMIASSIIHFHIFKEILNSSPIQLAGSSLCPDNNIILFHSLLVIPILKFNTSAG